MSFCSRSSVFLVSPLTRALRVALTVSAVGGSAFFAQSVGAQSVIGALTDASKVASYQGAKLSIPDLGLTVYSDERGRFRFPVVPAGDYELVVYYVGAAPTRLSISVPEQGLMLGDVVLGGADTNEYALEEVLVYGQSAAMASAINQQRAADNIVSVLDSDSIGQFPDQNVAESLRRLSGISVENDQGEGRYVVIRGMDPDLNATSINGVRATAAENRRALQLDVIPSDVLDGLEVQKSLTPDMDGDAIGGSINVKTLSAFSHKQDLLKIRLEGGYNELREEISPKTSVVGSTIFELNNEQRLGVAGALSWQGRKIAANNVEASDWYKTDNGFHAMEELEPRYYVVDRERLGAVLNIDFDMSESTTLYARTLYSEFEDTEIRYAQAWKDLTLLSSDSVTANSADIGFVELESSTKDRVQTADNFSFTLGSDSQWDSWTVETVLGYSRAKESDPKRLSSAWVAEFESGADDIVAGSPALKMDISDAKRPRIYSDYFNLLRDPARYELDELELESNSTTDTQWTVQLDATRAFSDWELKFGAKLRKREKENDENALVYGNDGDWMLSSFHDAGAASDYGFDNAISPMPSTSLLRALVAKGEGLELERIDSDMASLGNDWQVDEDIYAAYGMFKWFVGDVTLTGGVRLEHTDLTMRGHSMELFEEGAQYNGAVLDDDFLLVTDISSDNSYTDILPSINLRYEIRENLIARAAFSTSIVRPVFQDMAARISVEDGEASIGNPELDPYSALNFDASIEFYPSELSVVSAGVFHKEIDDFIFTRVLDDYNYGGRTYDEAEIALNGETATVSGLELNYQQHFGFLPAPWDGLLVSANLTVVDSEADIGGRTIAMPKQSDHLAGVVLGYDKGGLDIRLALKYRDRYLDEVVEEGYDRYVDEHTGLDLTAKYHITDQWMVYGEAINITDEPEYYYAGSKRRLLQYDEFGSTFVLGFQFIY